MIGCIAVGKTFQSPKSDSSYQKKNGNDLATVESSDWVCGGCNPLRDDWSVDMKREFFWLPETLDGTFPNGERWALYEKHPNNHKKYLGRVCKHAFGSNPIRYASDAGIFDSMRAAAEALLIGALT